MTEIINTKIKEPQKVLHKIGNWYKDSNGNLGLLVSVSSTKVLLVAPSGLRIGEPRSVYNLHEITEEEFSLLTYGYPNSYTHIEKLSINEI